MQERREGLGSKFLVSEMSYGNMKEVSSHKG